MAYITGRDNRDIDNLHFHGTNAFTPKSIGQTTRPITLGSASSSNQPLDIILELPIKSPALHPVFGPVFTPYPLFQWYLQSNEILLNLSMKCLNSVFNAEGWRVTNSSCTGRSSVGAQKRGKPG
jgi:hypothetical protein